MFIPRFKGGKKKKKNLTLPKFLALDQSFSSTYLIALESGIC